MPATEFRPGVELTTAALNEWDSSIAAGAVAVDASSGLVGMSLPSGSSFRSQRRAEGWFKVGPAPDGSPSGTYRITEQVDLEDGGWADGLTVRLAYPTPGSATPPTDGSRIVRAWKDRACWRFEYGGC